VDVDDVRAHRAQLLAQGRQRERRRREVRDRAVGLDTDRPAERDEPLGHLARLGAGTSMQPNGKPVGGVERREHPYLMAVGAELLGEGFDVTGDSARVRPRVRRHQGDAHRAAC